MILIYTGNGKGKTSACVGQAIRAAGQGLRVWFAQFIKQNVGAGEQKILSQMLGNRYLAGGEGFFFNEVQRVSHRACALKTFEWCKQSLKHADMLIMDEALYALGEGLLTDNELKDIIADCRKSSIHLVLSGRGLPSWIREEADIVTEMLEVKHPIHLGKTAIQGIEF